MQSKIDVKKLVVYHSLKKVSLLSHSFSIIFSKHHAQRRFITKFSPLLPKSSPIAELNVDRALMT
jgi:hypothetical protein